jgi:hypothetical protein
VALEEHLSFLERPFTDGRIDQEIAALAQKAAIMSDAVSAQAELRRIIAIQVSQGQNTHANLYAEDIKLIQVTNAKLDADLASSHAERKKIDLQDKLASASSKIVRDRDFLNAMDNALTIRSTINNGTFHPATIVNSFVRKGHVLGRIEL